MLSNINFMGKFNPKINLKNLDTPKIAGYTATGMGVAVPIADCFVKNNEVDKMSKEITQEDINKRIEQLCYSDVEEPLYTREDSEPEEYDISSTVTKYYDNAGTLRKKVVTSCDDTISDLEIYNSNGFLIFGADTTSPNFNNELRLGKIFYDGTENENIIKTEYLILNCNDLSTKPYII